MRYKYDTKKKRKFCIFKTANNFKNLETDLALVQSVAQFCKNLLSISYNKHDPNNVQGRNVDPVYSLCFNVNSS